MAAFQALVKPWACIHHLYISHIVNSMQRNYQLQKLAETK